MNSLYLNVECTIIKRTWLMKKDEPCDPDSSLLARNSLIYSFHMFPPTSILGSVSTPRPSMDRTTHGIIWSSRSLWRQKKQIMDGRWSSTTGIQEAVGKTDAGTFYFRRAERVKAINNRQSKDNIFRSEEHACHSHRKSLMFCNLIRCCHVLFAPQVPGLCHW